MHQSDLQAQVHVLSTGHTIVRVTALRPASLVCRLGSKSERLSATQHRPDCKKKVLLFVATTQHAVFVKFWDFSVVLVRGGVPVLQTLLPSFDASVDPFHGHQGRQVVVQRFPKVLEVLNPI